MRTGVVSAAQPWKTIKLYVITGGELRSSAIGLRTEPDEYPLS